MKNFANKHAIELYILKKISIDRHVFCIVIQIRIGIVSMSKYFCNEWCI